MSTLEQKLNTPNTHKQLFATSHMAFMVIGLIMGITFVAMSEAITPVLNWNNKKAIQYYYAFKKVLGEPSLYQKDKNGFAIWGPGALSGSCLYSIEVRDMKDKNYILKYSVKFDFKDANPPMYERMVYDVGTHILSYTGDNIKNIITKMWERMNHASTSLPSICASTKSKKNNCLTFAHMYSGKDFEKTKSFCTHWKLSAENK